MSLDANLVRGQTNVTILPTQDALESYYQDGLFQGLLIVTQSPFSLWMYSTSPPTTSVQYINAKYRNYWIRYADLAKDVPYDDSVSPPTGSTNVQGAIDYIKTHGSAPSEGFPADRQIVQLGTPGAPIVAGATYTYTIDLGALYSSAIVDSFRWVLDESDSTQAGVTLGLAAFSQESQGPMIYAKGALADRRVFRMLVPEHKDGSGLDIAAPMFANQISTGVALGYGDQPKQVFFDHIEVFGRQFQVEDVWLTSAGTTSLNVKVKNVSGATLQLQPYLGVTRAFGYRANARWQAVAGSDVVITVGQYPPQNVWISEDKGVTWANHPLGVTPLVGLSAFVDGSRYLATFLDYNFGVNQYASDTQLYTTLANPIVSGVSGIPDLGRQGWGGHPLDQPDTTNAIFAAFAGYSGRVYRTADNFATVGANSPSFNDGSPIFDVSTFEPSYSGARPSWMHPFLRMRSGAPDEHLASFDFTVNGPTEGIGSRNALYRTTNGGATWANPLLAHEEYRRAHHAVHWATPSAQTILVAIVARDYSTDLKPWTSTTALPSARYGFDASAFNGFVYAVGGNDGSTPVDAVLYAPINGDGTIGTWGTTTSLPAKLEGARAFAWKGFLYVLGGIDDAGAHHSQIYSAPIAGGGTIGSWTATTPLPSGRTAYFAYAISGDSTNGDYLYVGGGNVQHDTLAYTGANQAWTAGEVVTGTLSGATGTVLAGVGPGDDTIQFVDGSLVGTFTDLEPLTGDMGTTANANGSNATAINTIGDVSYAQIPNDGTLSAWTATNGFNAKQRFQMAATNQHPLNSFLDYLGAFMGYLPYSDPSIEAGKRSGSPNIDGWFDDANGGQLGGIGIAQTINGRVYLTGGVQGDTPSDPLFNTVKTWAPGIGGHWTDAGENTPFPNARFLHGSFAYNDRLYVLGGLDSSSARSDVYFTEFFAAPYADGSYRYNRSDDAGATWLHAPGAWSEIAAPGSIHPKYASDPVNAQAISEAFLFSSGPRALAVIRDTSGAPAISRTQDGTTWSALSRLSAWAAGGVDVTTEDHASQNDANAIFGAFAGYGYAASDTQSNLYVSGEVSTFATLGVWGLP